MYLRMHLIFIYYCVIILTIRVTIQKAAESDETAIAMLAWKEQCWLILGDSNRVTATDMSKNSCKAAESAIYRTILRMAGAAGSLEKGRKGMEENEF